MKRLRTSTWLAIPLLWIAATPPEARAQVDSTSLHATLSHWDETTWLQYLDRDAALGGRLSDLGILQRFQEDIDFEYQIDRLAASFSLTENYDWYRRQTNGVRWTGTSITKRDLLTGAQFKTAIGIGKSWAIGVQIDQARSPTTDRTLLRVSFGKRWDSGLYAMARASLDPLKPGSDLELGVGWRSSHAPDPRHEAKLTLAVVDWASNLIYLGLNAAEQPQVDSKLVYRKGTLAFRGSISSRISGPIRLEAFGAISTPSTLDQYAGFDEALGLRQEENFGYAGGLLEWSARPDLRFGGFATYVEARTLRTGLPAAPDVEEYRLVERTTNLGAYGLWGMGRSWHLEGAIARNWRPEEREFLNAEQPDVDYLDQSWIGQLVARRSVARGLLADLGLLWDLRDVVRGDGQVPSAGTLGRHNYRVTALLGWRFNEHVDFRFGIGIDLDADHSGSNWFDGLRGRFTVVW